MRRKNLHYFRIQGKYFLKCGQFFIKYGISEKSQNALNVQCWRIVPNAQMYLYFLTRNGNSCCTSEFE